MSALPLKRPVFRPKGPPKRAKATYKDPRTLRAEVNLSQALYHLTERSDNGKTGPIPVTSSPAQTCPTSCPFIGAGCYGENYGINFTWNRLTLGTMATGLTWEQFLLRLSRLPANSLGRHNQVGDLPGAGDLIDLEALAALTSALTAKGKRFWTYTHKPLNAHNLPALRAAVAKGFTVNVSCETPAQAQAALDAGLPAVLAVPRGYPKHSRLPSGHPILLCPQQDEEREAKHGPLTCLGCKGLCWISSPKRPVVAFRGHGSQVKKLELVLEVLNG